jgi:hypothetical protein
MLQRDQCAVWQHGTDHSNALCCAATRCAVLQLMDDPNSQRLAKESLAKAWHVRTSRTAALGLLAVL